MFPSYLVPYGQSLNLLPAGVLRHKPHAPGRCSTFCSAGSQIGTAALAASVARPGDIAILKGLLRRGVKHHPPALGFSLTLLLTWGRTAGVSLG